MKYKKELATVEKIYVAELLSERLRYRTKALITTTGEIINVAGVVLVNDFEKHEDAVIAHVFSDKGDVYQVGVVRPYLRSISTATKGELEGLQRRTEFGLMREILNEWHKLCHFDSKDYIKKGLAIEAPANMVEYQTGMGNNENGLI
jgi:hypothetical protein